MPFKGYLASSSMQTPRGKIFEGLKMEDLADAVMKLINEKPYSPRKEEIMALLAAEKWRNVLSPHLRQRAMTEAPKDGTVILIFSTDGTCYPAYYGLAVDKDGNSCVAVDDADEDFPWVVFDPYGGSSAVSDDEGKFWLEVPKP